MNDIKFEWFSNGEFNKIYLASIGRKKIFNMFEENILYFRGPMQRNKEKITDTFLLQLNFYKWQNRCLKNMELETAIQLQKHKKGSTVTKKASAT